MSDAILLVDDDAQLLDELRVNLVSALSGTTGVDVLAWNPQPSESNPQQTFLKFLSQHEVRFVVVDWDLTKGHTGFYGTTIIDWCQDKAIPVGDFSRKPESLMPQRPKLFELRVPVRQTDVSAAYIAGVYQGFRSIDCSVESDATLSKTRSAAATLAGVLGVPDLESEFALYTTPYGLELGQHVPQSTADKKRLLTYVVGHLLLNSVLKFPGPILNKEALCAFLAVDKSEFEVVAPLFAAACYEGPFASLDRFHWTKRVSERLDEFAASGTVEGETSGELNRLLLERKIGRQLALPKGCPRCGGKNGGFLCPLTHRVVCERADCSAASSSWIPRGAYVCRIERDRYEEWAPVVGP